jgi:hypothetical protein
MIRTSGWYCFISYCSDTIEKRVNRTHVGCSLVQAGTQPLKINIGPSVASLPHQQVLLDKLRLALTRVETYEVLMTPAMVLCPEAFMILDLSTSAGEQTAK